MDWLATASELELEFPYSGQARSLLRDVGIEQARGLGRGWRWLLFGFGRGRFDCLGLRFGL